MSLTSGYRGKEIYNPRTDDIYNGYFFAKGWYWLDNAYGGRVAMNKEVYMPYTINGKDNIGKWVRYDSRGTMVKGWYQSPSGDYYYYDLVTGAMKKGTVSINGRYHYFDTKTGVLVW